MIAQVDITFRIDCDTKDSKVELAHKLDAQNGEWPVRISPDACSSLNQKSLRIKWELFENDWELYVLDFLKHLVEEKVTGVFGISCVWGGVDEYWSFIEDELERFKKWNGKSISRFLPNYQSDIDQSLINKIRKDRLQNSKLSGNKLFDIHSFDFDLEMQNREEARKTSFENEYSQLVVPKIIGEHWDCNDPVWLRARLREWNVYVLPRLKMRRISSKCLGLYKEMFLFGTLFGVRLFENSEFNYDLKPFDEGQNDRRFDLALDTDVWPLILIWFHPKVDVLVPKLPRFLEYVLSHGMKMNYLRDAMGKLYSNPEVDYGAMNGNEEYVMNFLVPAHRKNQTLYIVDAHGKEMEVNVGLDKIKPSWIAYDTQKELIGDARFTPFEPRQFLWEHVSGVMEHEPEYFFPIESMDDRLKFNLKQTQRSFQVVISRIFDFENRIDKSSKRPSTISMVEKLLSMYEKKQFSDPMIALWDKTKKNLKRELGMNKSKFYMSYADVSAHRQNIWSQKRQEYLMSGWRQID